MYTNIIWKYFVLFVLTITTQCIFQTSICFPASEVQEKVTEKSMKGKWLRGDIQSNSKITQKDTMVNVTKGSWSRGGMRHSNTINVKVDTNFTPEKGTWSRGGVR